MLPGIPDKPLSPRLLHGYERKGEVDFELQVTYFPGQLWDASHFISRTICLEQGRVACCGGGDLCPICRGTSCRPLTVRIWECLRHLHK